MKYAYIPSRTSFVYMMSHVQGTRVQWRIKHDHNLRGAYTLVTRSNCQTATNKRYKTQTDHYNT